MKIGIKKHKNCKIIKSLLCSKWILMLIAMQICASGFAQLTATQNTPLLSNNKLPQALKDVHINLYLRSSLEFPLHTPSLNKDNFLSAFKLNEARFEIMGTIWKSLNFRMRTRFSTTRPQFQLSNSNNNIDYALVGYKFGDGERKPFELAVGKQNNMIGSWEFWNKPTFEYKYSSIGGGTAINIFPVGARFSYTPSDKHSFTLQAFNTYSSGFNSNITNTENFKPVRVPVTVLLAWKGNLCNKHLQTWYSLAMKNYALNRPNYQIALGHNLQFSRFNLYLDLVSTYTAFDYTKLLQTPYTAYYNHTHPNIVNAPQIARDFVYSSAILRADYQFLPRFFLTAKTWYERADAVNNSQLGSGFYNNFAFLLGLEYKPIKTQNMRIFAYYYNNKYFYNQAIPRNILPGTINQTFALGLLYYLEVL